METTMRSLEWHINDAKEALTNAVAMGDWTGVIKYALQLKSLEADLYRLGSTPINASSR